MKHPGLPVALDIVGRLLKPGTEPTLPKPLRLNPAYLLHRELLRLTDVTPEEALASVVSVWLFALRNPKAFPDDRRSVDYAMGRAVLKLRPLAVATARWDHEENRQHIRYRAIPGLAAGFLGRQLRKHLGVFLIRLSEYIDQRHEQELQRKLALSRPILITTTLEGES
jgi:hypothetical protein